MKLIIVALLAGSTSAFGNFGAKKAALSAPSANTFTIDNLPGAI
eukprot:CAMPEP_0178933864 /NCGR_PEP_ID=MMETSP0786-20121207/23536_1 /TAXON_ID=186022 /ORGANISM="Thalassionema frauenfeldii, Strain CCMP 1798" /LENGTH=43 /DNA_ID= /DNA_START= /DNA_END= /DNA_ORIENTATION=